MGISGNWSSVQPEGIQHERAKVSRPQFKGVVERLPRTLPDEPFRVEGRKTWFETVDEMQTALDIYLTQYNKRRPDQGWTLISAFIKDIPKRGQEGGQNTPSATTKPTAA